MPNYLKGVMWFVMVSLVSASNDALIKYLGLRLSGIEVAFFRFFFSCITLLPFMFKEGVTGFRTAHLGVHGVRAVFLFLAIAPWCYGVIYMPLPLVTTISFTTPLFTLLLAHLFLKEHVGAHRIVATCFGFLGIVISTGSFSFHLHWSVWLLLLSTLLFASLDILNKKLLVESESLLKMLFFSALGTTVISLPFAVLDWQMPDARELLILCCLGVGANLILYCLLKAFQYADLSALQPFRYVELVLATLFGVAFFGQWPSVSTLLGAALIIPSTLYIVHQEMRDKPKSDAKKGRSSKGGAVSQKRKNNLKSASMYSEGAS